MRLPPLPETCGVAYMRASMKCLSRVHASAFALRRSLGGKRPMLRMFPEIEERRPPKWKVLKVCVYVLCTHYLY